MVQFHYRSAPPSLWLRRWSKLSWTILNVTWLTIRDVISGLWESSCTSCYVAILLSRATVATNADGTRENLATRVKNYSFTPSRTVISTFLRPSGRTSPMRLKTSSPSSSSRMPVNVFPPKWFLLTLGSDSVDHPGSWLLHKTSKGKKS